MRPQVGTLCEGHERRRSYEEMACIVPDIVASFYQHIAWAASKGGCEITGTTTITLIRRYETTRCCFFRVHVTLLAFTDRYDPLSRKSSNVFTIVATLRVVRPTRGLS